MKKNVLFSLLAVGVAPTAAMADANVAVATDKATDWTGDNSLAVTGGDLIYSSGAEVTRGYALEKGKYKLSAESVTNATITAEVGGKSYALDTEFELSEKTVVTIKAVSDGKSTAGLNANEFTFGNVSFTLVFDFTKVSEVIELKTLLSQIINQANEGLGTDNAKWKEGGSLAVEGSGLGAIIKAIENGNYDTYCKYQLWDAANSTELADLKKKIESFSTKVNAEIASQKAYDAATASLDGVQSALDELTNGAWASADKDYTQPRNKEAYDKLVSDLADKKDELAKAYEAGNANTVETEEFIKSFNEALETLKTNIVTDDADAAAWDAVNAKVTEAKNAYNEVNVALTNLLKDENYKAMLDEAQAALRAELLKVNGADESNGGTTRASEQSAENKDANIQTLTEAIAAIKKVQTDYTTKYNTNEANKKAADEVTAKLTTNIDAIKACEDVAKEYADDIKDIEDAIAALDTQNAADYASPYAMSSADYTVNEGSDIQEKIEALTDKAQETLNNYNAYQELIKNTLQSELDTAKAAVAKLDVEAYSASGHFAATAEGLQKTVDDIKAEIEAAYKDKTAAAKQDDILTEIDNASAAIEQYQADAEGAKQLYDEISKALAGYDKSIADLVSTATDTNAKVGTHDATPAAGEGKTYGERIEALKSASKTISDAFNAANAMLDADHLSALQDIALNDQINTDAANLKSWYGDDKKQSDINDRLEAAQNMWSNVTAYVDQVQKTIDSHQNGGSDEWLEGNEDGQLGNKYKELTDSLAELENKLAEQKDLIPAKGDITEATASDYISKLTEIRDAVEAIKASLSDLESQAQAQIEKVKAENAAHKETTERNEELQTALEAVLGQLEDESKTDDVQKDIDAIQELIEGVAIDIEKNRNDEKLVDARAGENGIDARQDAIEKKIADLNDKVKDINANKAAQDDLQKQLTDKGFLTTDTGIFATAEAGIKANTDGTNADHYLGLIEGWESETDAKGGYAKEYYAIVKAIADAYESGTADADKETLEKRINDLAGNVGELPELAKADFDANKTLTGKGTNVQDYWNATNAKLNTTDLNQETVQPYIDKLNAILPEITAENEKVADYYKNGQSADSLITATRVYEDILKRIKEINDFMSGDAYNIAISGDNQGRWDAYCIMRDSARTQYNYAQKLIRGYLGVQNEEIKASLGVIIEAQKDIYGYQSLINDMDNEAISTFTSTEPPAVWDKNETYKAKAKTYLDELTEKVKNLSDQVNAAAKQLLATKLADLRTKLDDAKATVADYESTVQENAFDDVQKFYDKVSATDYINSQELIINLDNDWSTFDKIDDMLAADLENAAQAEWDKLYNGVYSDYKETDADRYQGAKKTYEEQLAAIKGFTFDPTEEQTYLDDYENMVEETLNVAIVMADEAKEAGNMADAITNIKSLVDEFFISELYKYAKDAAEKWTANVDAYNTLLADYAAVQSRIDAVKAYYEAYFYTNADFDKIVAQMQAQLDAYKAQLTKQNASSELADRENEVYGTITEGKKWYDCDKFNQTIVDLYQQANEKEEAGLRVELAALDSEVQTAVDDCYSKGNAELAKTLQAKYDELQPALINELDALIESLEENFVDQDSLWQGNGLLDMEKKIAKARAEFSALWKTGLAADVLAQLNDAIADAQESLDAAGNSANKYGAVAQKFADELAAEQSDIDKLKDDVDGYGSEIVLYSDKVLEKVKEIEDAIKATKASIDDFVVKYDAHTAKYNELKAENEAIQAEYDRVVAVKDGFQHITMPTTWDAFDAENGELVSHEGTWNDYYAGALAIAKAYIDANNEFLANAEKAAEGSDDSALLTDNAKLPKQEADVTDGLLRIERTAYGNEAKLIYIDAMKEAYNALAQAVNAYNAQFSCDYANISVKPSTMILDENGTLKAEYEAIGDGLYNVNAYNSHNSSKTLDGIEKNWGIQSVENTTVDTYWGINGERIATTDEDGNYVPVTINYVKDEAGYKAVIAKAQELQARAEALLPQIEANSFMKGDITADGNVMADDYMQILSIVVGNEQLEEGSVEFARADVNSDGKLNISDVTLIATKVTTGLWPSNGPVTDASGAKPQSAEAFSLVSESTAEGQRIAINLSNYKDYVAGQMDIILPAGATVLSETVTDRANGQQLYSSDLGNGVHRIVLSGLEGGVFNSGETLVYLEISGKGTVQAENVIFSDAYGNATEFVTKGEATGIDGVEAESNLKQKIYSVGGQIMNGLKKGLNIIRKADGTTQKVVNK